MTPIQLADEMLNFLTDNPEAKGNITIGDLFNAINKRFKINQTTYFSEILDEFEAEKYIIREKRIVQHIDGKKDEIEERIICYITLKGRLFRIDGGYQGKIDREFKAQQYQKHQVQLLATYQKWVLIGTLVAASYYLKELVVWAIHLSFSCH